MCQITGFVPPDTFAAAPADGSMSAPDPQRAACDAMAERLAGDGGPGEEVRVLGPAPAPLARIKRRYRWHLLATAPGHEALLAALRRAGEGLRLRRGVQLVVDVDPVSLL